MHTGISAGKKLKGAITRALLFFDNGNLSG